ncbi:hypothetical protein SCP_0506650 [Sparassis crispa]|uniref:Uncharacterized protein n=1 Tax=Sparassis crispa TaxID=139825 RepID=A0A401GN59_9APHY|nr:hypothetical protein SCP_0506650 [Sparassis crispa]GBE83610.1 hypothetical protein SCP_0506650 [Sparassis crispa]
MLRNRYVKHGHTRHSATVYAVVPRHPNSAGLLQNVPSLAHPSLGEMMEEASPRKVGRASTFHNIPTGEPSEVLGRPNPLLPAYVESRPFAATSHRRLFHTVNPTRSDCTLRDAAYSHQRVIVTYLSHKALQTTTNRATRPAWLHENARVKPATKQTIVLGEQAANDIDPKKTFSRQEYVANHCF